MKRYVKLCESSLLYHEKNDCSVKTLSIVGDFDYELSHKVLEKYGRQPRSGTYFWEQFVPAATELGLVLTPINPYYLYRKSGSKFHAYTPVSISKNKAVKKGKFICVTDTHMFAVVDGVVEDWTEEKRKRYRIRDIYEVTKK